MVILLGLDADVVDKGIGQMGSIAIPISIWDMLAPSDFGLVAASNLGPMKEISEEGLVMARALVQDGILRPCVGS